MDVQGFRHMLCAICDRVIDSEKLLCELDGFVGDGDHGVTVSRGFRAVKQQLLTAEELSPAQLCEGVGETITATMGGAIGPIVGGIFSDGGEALENCVHLDTPEVAAMLQAGLEGVMLIGGAKPGDRTLVDALEPAARSMTRSAREGAGLREALEQAALAAEAGAKATEGMVAKKGRARFLGEKSKGHRDAGATTMQIILRAMADSCAGLPPEKEGR